MQKIAKSLESAFAWSRSLLCRIVVKLHFQLFNNVDIFSQRVAFSQEDMRFRNISYGLICASYRSHKEYTNDETTRTKPFECFM